MKKTRKPKLKKVFELAGERYSDGLTRVGAMDAGRFDSVQPHSHNFIEIVYFVKGSGISNVDGTIVHYDQGEMAMIANRLAVHTINADKSSSTFRIRNLIVPFSLFDIDVSKIPPTFVFTERMIPNLSSIFDSIYQEETEENEGYQIIINDFASILMREALRAYQGYLALEKKRKAFGQNYVLLAKDFIKDNYSKPISVKDVAEACSISQDYLQEIFKKKSTMSVKQCIVDERLRNSQYKLLSSTETIEDVANDCGFADMKYFYVLFKKYFGITPKEWRERYNQKRAGQPK